MTMKTTTFKYTGTVKDPLTPAIVPVEWQIDVTYDEGTKPELEKVKKIALMDLKRLYDLCTHHTIYEVTEIREGETV